MNAGDSYGRYQIIRPLGRGAMGEVYLALDVELRCQIALKVVYRGNDAEDAEVLEAEQVGAELQKRLSGYDKRIVTVNRYGTINGDLFIDMEYIEGEDLSTLLSRGPLIPGRAAVYTIELCEMLENLHNFSTVIADKQFTGVVHGDLKPKNVRINTANQVKVLDFGISKALSHTRKQTMNVFASTAYCSPERIESGNMDLRSDLWSAGVLLYQMVSGRLPFDQQTKENLERRIKSHEPPDPLPATCPAALRNIVFQMLARDPARRYQTATEAKEDLTRFLRGVNVVAVPYESDATVRTVPSVTTTSAGERTRRTGGSPGAPARIIWSGRIPPKTVFTAIGMFIVVVLLVFQFTAMSDAGKLRADLEAERILNLDDAWKSYQQLGKRTVFPPLLWSARHALESKLVASADHIILKYRDNDGPSVYEQQWRQARASLSRALELDPGNDSVKGKMRLCEGHLARIAATGPNRHNQITEAVERFQEAAALLKNSPDPYLGLARLYAYNLNDMEKAQNAIHDAEQRGFKPGKRESAQIADGYRILGDRLWIQSRSLTRRPAEEREYLQRARENYQRALDLYQQLGVFQNTVRNRAITMESLQRVDQRMAEPQTVAVP